MTGERMFALFTLLWILDDAIAIPDQQLTDAAHRINRRHSVLWKFVLGLTYMHLANLYRPLGIAHLDPYTNAALATRTLIGLLTGQRARRVPRVQVLP